MHRIRRLRSIGAVLVSEVAAIVALQRLGRSAGFAPPHHHLVPWLLHAPTEDVFAVAARLLGLGLAWWLLAASGLSIARRVIPGWRHLRALDLVTPAAVRHVLDRALAVGLGASLGLASMHPAGASTPRPHAPRPRTETPVVRAPAGHTAPARATTAATPASAAGARTHATAPTHHGRIVVVQAGDNLWLIARRALRAPPGSPLIEPYWRRVIAANAATLRSHDPNLIFPGEHVVLPPG